MIKKLLSLFRLRKASEKVTEAYVKAQQFSAPKAPVTKIPIPPKRQPARRYDPEPYSSRAMPERARGPIQDSSWGLSDSGSSWEPSGSRDCGSSYSSSDSGSSCSSSSSD